MAIMKNLVWIVKDVHPNNNYTLLLTFENGETKLYDASPLLEKKIYSRLKNLTFFLNANVECGIVVWNDDIDIAPEHLYECSRTMNKKFVDDDVKELFVMLSR